MKLKRSYEVAAVYRICEAATAGSSLARADSVVQALAQWFRRPFHKSVPESLVLKFPRDKIDELDRRAVKFCERGDYVTVQVKEYRIFTTFTSRAKAVELLNELEQYPVPMQSLELLEVRHCKSKGKL